MSQATNYSAIRSQLLFYQDAHQGGPSWQRPSPSTLSTAQLSIRLYDRTTDRVVTRQGDTYNTYLVPFRGEESANFAARIQKTPYINLCQPIVSSYVDAALQKVYRNLGPLKDVLAEDVDYKDSSYPEFIYQCAESFAVYGSPLS